MVRFTLTTKQKQNKKKDLLYSNHVNYIVLKCLIKTRQLILVVLHAKLGVKLTWATFRKLALFDFIQSGPFDRIVFTKGSRRFLCFPMWSRYRQHWTNFREGMEPLRVPWASRHNLELNRTVIIVVVVIIMGIHRVLSVTQSALLLHGSVEHVKIYTARGKKSVDIILQ